MISQDAGTPPGLLDQAAMHLVIDETVASVRRIAADLRPALLDELGLIPAIEWLGKEFSARHGITVVTHAAEEDDVGGARCHAIFRIVQEALSNVVQHAQADRVDIELVRQDGHYELTVRDNGSGNAADAASRRRARIAGAGRDPGARTPAWRHRGDQAGARRGLPDGTLPACRVFELGGKHMIPVMIADDHAVVRDGLRHILSRAGGFEVVAEAVDGNAVLQMGARLQAASSCSTSPCQGRSGLELIRQLRGAARTACILVLTMHAEEPRSSRAFRAGAAGYLTKESAATELVSAIGVAVGRRHLREARDGREIGQRSLQDEHRADPHLRLSDREMEVYRRLVLRRAAYGTSPGSASAPRP
ncbi:ATP-binding response regulator [Cupriavidus basilensis]